MRTIPLGVAALLATLTAATLAQANTLQVGPTRTFTTPCTAIAAAMPNDTVAIDPGTYTDTCAITVKGLTVQGVGGRPKIDVSAGAPSGKKGIYVIDADDVTIENLELTGAHIGSSDGEDGAAIRVEAGNFTIRGCFLHDNQDGILATPNSLSALLTVEGNEFSGNGQGNGCDDGNGCTHSIYVSHNNDKVVFQYNWSHSLASDTADKGHLFKSRANQSFVLYNRLTGEGDKDSYGIDISNGGLAVILGNMIEKPAGSGNGSSIAYGLEGISNTDHRLFVVNNTLVNDKGGGTFFNVASGGTLVAHNNLFVGTGSLSSTGALSADNLATMSPGFVDQAGFDYHLTAGAAALNLGVAPGSADSFSLTPTQEYVHPVKHVARASDGMLDLGAFELGTNTMGSGGTGGSATTGPGTGATGGGATTGSSTGAGGGSGGSASTGGANAGTGAGKATGTGGASSGNPSEDSGCSIAVAGDERSAVSALASLALALAVAGRRRRAR